jgi:hypothetical protein
MTQHVPQFGIRKPVVDEQLPGVGVKVSEWLFLQLFIPTHGLATKFGRVVDRLIFEPATYILIGMFMHHTNGSVW